MPFCFSTTKIVYIEKHVKIKSFQIRPSEAQKTHLLLKCEDSNSQNSFMIIRNKIKNNTFQAKGEKHDLWCEGWREYG